jgi:hypothetical protein
MLKLLPAFMVYSINRVQKCLLGGCGLLLLDEFNPSHGEVVFLHDEEIRLDILKEQSIDVLAF